MWLCLASSPLVVYFSSSSLLHVDSFVGLVLPTIRHPLISSLSHTHLPTTTSSPPDNAGFDFSFLPFQLPYPVPFRLLGDEVKGWLEVGKKKKDTH